MENNNVNEVNRNSNKNELANNTENRKMRKAISEEEKRENQMLHYILTITLTDSNGEQISSYFQSFSYTLQISNLGFLKFILGD